MDLYPVVDETSQLDLLKSEACYLLIGSGNAPSARVGHTCVAVAENNHTCVYFIGGANPNGSFSEMYGLDLREWKWSSYPATNFTGRYEHAAFASENSIFVFGGANATGNLKEIQKWDLDRQAWDTIDAHGNGIEARTHHTSAVIEGTKLIVFSGGHNGANPIADDKLHVFDITNNTWSTPDTEGSEPSPRQGHMMIALDKKVYLHGGMAGNTYYDDFYTLDFETMTWNMLKIMENQPSARAAHSGAVHNQQIFVFGGMNETGALNDMKSFDTEQLQWTELVFSTNPPAPRLDFAMCAVRLPCGKPDTSVPEDGGISNVPQLRSMSESPTTTDASSNEEGTNTELSSFILIHGGMNTDGDIYDDCFLIKI